MQLTLQFDDPRWKAAEKTLSARVKAAVALVTQDYDGEADTLTVKCADDKTVQALNAQFRGQNKPTNVLSFPNEDAPLGDIILAYETVAREAVDQQKSFTDHTLHLVIHGTLHLLGYDHENDEEAEEMEALEIFYLAKLGIANPYIAR
jgi:probable rRNA maturation factor